MRLAILYSGGKDSNFALFEASKRHDVVCLIVMKSKNFGSYMFQSAGIDCVKFQAEALGLPLVEIETKGEKEEELLDLEIAIKEAKKKYNIDGIVSGAINSIYQSSRIQKICNRLNLWSFNPLWQKDQLIFLEELIENKFKVVIVGIASYPFDESYLGRVLDKKLLEELCYMRNKYQINPAGEGGEIETFILDTPTFKKELCLIKSRKVMDSINSGFLVIEEVKLKGK